MTTLHSIGLSLCTVIGLLLVSGCTRVSPVDDIEGCYDYEFEGNIDSVCLNDDGTYSQHFQQDSYEPVSYNRGSWRSFRYRNDLGEFTAGVLYDYILMNSSGKSVGTLELDIQPYENERGRVVFEIGLESPRTRVYERR